MRTNNIAPILWEGVFRVEEGPQGPFAEASPPGSKKLAIPIHLATALPPKGVYGFGRGIIEEGFVAKKPALVFVLKFFEPAGGAKAGGLWVSGVFEVKEVRESEVSLKVGSLFLKGYHRLGKVPEGKAYVRGKVGGVGKPFLLIEHLFHLERAERPEVILPEEPPF